MTAKSYFAEYTGPLLVSYSDMPFIESQTLRALMDKHCAENAVMTLLTTAQKSRPEFGRLLYREGKVCRISDFRVPAASDEAASDEVDAGFYCFKAPDFWEYLGRVQNNNNRREFILTEIVSHLAEDEQKISTYFIDDLAQTIGINRPAELIEAERLVYTRSKRRMAGASSVPPEAEIYWKLRFYEAFGGVRADMLLQAPSDQTQLSAFNMILAAYDDALEREIGPIFVCPAMRDFWG
jgi:bifunctional UDP-N-acetylglucosamine pyrophosphorylase/glucosamine-1-phosphate N-acetyltransferase